MKTREEILTKERLEYVRGIRNEAREATYTSIKDLIGEAALAELRTLYDVFDEKIYIWLAGLWDNETGAFYYSNSARDTELYRPDVESTVQALRFISNTGMLPVGEGNYTQKIPTRMRDAVVKFIYALQDVDGYFYHPQWGKDVGVSRRGRDLGWSRQFLSEAGVTPKYLLPTQKTADGQKSKSLPEYLQTIDAFKEYLAAMDLSKNSYGIGNLIDSTCSQITAAGDEFKAYLIDWLDSQNRADNGLWEPQINYASVNGLMKISGNYPHLHVNLKYPLKSLESAIAAAMSDERMKFVCEAYNPWVAIGNIFKANKDTPDLAELEKLRAHLIDNAAALIKKTREKISVFRKPDGSYSYFKRMSACIAQGAPAAVPRTNEGDVNSTGICVSGTVRSMHNALCIPFVPIFTPEDGKLFFELAENNPPVKKLYKNPGGDKFPPRVPYEEEIAE